MKRIIFTLSSFLCLFLVQLKAQNIFPAGGSAGIGTTTPGGALDVQKTYASASGVFGVPAQAVVKMGDIARTISRAVFTGDW